jgi:predicted SprT family Zn-dependent metalloprotease
MLAVDTHEQNWRVITFQLGDVFYTMTDDCDMATIGMTYYCHHCHCHHHWHRQLAINNDFLYSISPDTEMI